MVVRGKTLVQKRSFERASHFVVRSIGFCCGVALRELGAQAMGLVELAQSAQMLLITLVVTGLPAAVSRLCAKAGGPGAGVVRCALPAGAARQPDPSPRWRFSCASRCAVAGRYQNAARAAVFPAPSRFSARPAC